MLRRSLLTAALLALTAALAPVSAQELFIPAGYDPTDPEQVMDAVLSLVPCTDAGLTRQILEGSEGYRIEGQFLEVKKDDLCRSFSVGLRTGVAYKAVLVEFDIEVKKWVTPIFHNITSLRRTGKKKHERILYYGLIIRGDRRRTILDLGAERQLKQDHPWRENTKYRVVMEANLPSKRIKMDVFNEDGSYSHGSQGKMTAREIKSFGGDRDVKIDFSSGGIASHAYFPPTGWKFSNLKVTAIP